MPYYEHYMGRRAKRRIRNQEIALITQKRLEEEQDKFFKELANSSSPFKDIIPFIAEEVKQQRFREKYPTYYYYDSEDWWDEEGDIVKEKEPKIPRKGPHYWLDDDEEFIVSVKGKGRNFRIVASRV